VPRGRPYHPQRGTDRLDRVNLALAELARTWQLAGLPRPRKTTRHPPAVLLFSHELILARALTGGP